MKRVDTERKEIGERRIFLAIPVVLAVVCMFPALVNDFAYDDLAKIAALESTTPRLSTYLNFSRSLTQATFMVDYLIWGRWAPGFHLTTILLHGVASFLVALLAHAVSRSRAISLWCGSLFAVHPVHVEAVASFTNRKDVLALIFALLGLSFWLKEERPTLNYVRAGLCFLLALVSKEVAAAGLCVMFVLADVLLVRKPSVSPRLRLERALLRGSPFLLGAILVPSVWIRAPLALFRPAHIESLTEQQLESYGQVLANSAAAVVEYARLLIFPLRLSADYAVHPDIGLTSPVVAGGIVLLLSWCATAVTLRRSYPVAAFGMAWVVVMIFPISNVVPLSAFFVADRYMYTPSFGWCLAVAVLAERVGRRSVARRLVLIAILFLAALRSGVRARDWADNMSLWQSALDQGFDTYRAHANLGHALVRSGQYAAAVQHYERAAEISTRTIWLRHSLAATLQVMGRPKEALQHCEHVLGQDPDDRRCHLIAGEALMQMGDDRAAFQHFSSILQHSPEDPMALVRTAQILARRAETDPSGAEQVILLSRLALRAAQRTPELHREAWRLLVQSLALANRWDEARAECRSLLEVVTDDATCTRILSQSEVGAQRR